MRYFIIILLFLNSINLIAQNYFNERFEFYYPQGADGALNAMDIEDGYILNGATGDSLNPFWRRLGMVKFNKSGELIWQKSWGDTVSLWYYAARGSFIKHMDAYYTVGSKRSFYDDYSHSETVLIKYNQNFDTIWTSTYGKKHYPYDSSYIARNFAGIENGFVIVGTLVIQTDSSGFYIPTSEIAFRNNEAILTSNVDYYYYHEPYLLIMDSLGDVEYEYSYPDSGFYFHGNSIVQTSDGGYAIGAYKHIIGNYGIAIGDPIILKTDSLGNKEWELNLGGPYPDGTAILCRSEDGHIIAVSRYDLDSVYHDKYLSKVQLTKVDNEGYIIWNKFLGDKELWSRPTNLRIDSSGGYIISGKTADNYYPDEPFDMGFILRTNDEGDSLWYRKYAVLWDKSSSNYLYDAIPTSDGGFLGAGYCLPAGQDTGTKDAWIIKVDSLGCTSPTDCWVGEKEIVWVTSETGNQIKIYPNPAQTWFGVEIGKNKESDRSSTVEVFDLFGRLTEMVEIPKGQNIIRLYVSDWKRGMYLVRVKKRNSVLGSGKLVIK
jgi:hypothetical protein